MVHKYYFFAGGFLGVRVVLPVDVDGVGTIGDAFASGTDGTTVIQGLKVRFTCDRNQ